MVFIFGRTVLRTDMMCENNDHLRIQPGRGGSISMKWVEYTGMDT